MDEARIAEIEATAPCGCQHCERDKNDLITALRAARADALREAAQICRGTKPHIVPVPCPDGKEGCLVAHGVTTPVPKSAREIEHAILALIPPDPGTKEKTNG